MHFFPSIVVDTSPFFQAPSFSSLSDFFDGSQTSEAVKVGLDVFGVLFHAPSFPRL